jgi:ribosomal protein L17
VGGVTTDLPKHRFAKSSFYSFEEKEMSTTSVEEKEMSTTSVEEKQMSTTSVEEKEMSTTSVEEKQMTLQKKSSCSKRRRAATSKVTGGTHMVFLIEICRGSWASRPDLSISTSYFHVSYCQRGRCICGLVCLDQLGAPLIISG